MKFFWNTLKKQSQEYPRQNSRERHGKAKQEDQALKVSNNDAMNLLSNVAVTSLAHPHKEEEAATTRQCARETPRSASSHSLALLGSEKPHEESVGGALGTTPSRFSSPTPFSLFTSHAMFPSIQHPVENAIATPSSGGPNASLCHPSHHEGPSPFLSGVATGGGHLVSSTSSPPTKNNPFCEHLFPCCHNTHKKTPLTKHHFVFLLETFSRCFEVWLPFFVLYFLQTARLPTFGGFHQKGENCWTRAPCWGMDRCCK